MLPEAQPKLLGDSIHMQAAQPHRHRPYHFLPHVWLANPRTMEAGVNAPGEDVRLLGVQPPTKVF